VLPRILQGIFDADPNFGPVHLIKVDITNGFYRVCINPADIPKLGVGSVSAPAPSGLIRLYTSSPP
jgi:hypothetical protein